ncbi:MAG: T9SS type A sorting domain-containing protein [Bacteroidales bacterium]|nr:T9SS type A sorting domain-containing protein [Bacteroidales bacterium]
MIKGILLILLFVLGANMAFEARSENANATKTVGASGADYSTLKLAFDAINAGTINGDITLQIIGSTTETSSAVLNASGSGSASYSSVSIYPTSSGLSISGNLGNVPIIDLNGADYVTIDGRVDASGSTYNLIISNSSMNENNTSTIRFINDASYNTVKYCTLKGSTRSGAAGILFFSTGTLGNNYNTMDHNEITNAGGNRPCISIFSKGSTNVPNSYDSFTNNNVHDVINPNPTAGYIINFSGGTSGGDSYSSAWTITGNSFYETTAYTITTSYDYNIIYIICSTGTNYNISNNYIGGSAPLCGGTPWVKSTGCNSFCGIRLTCGTAAASNVQGNTIKNFNYTNSSAYYTGWTGIAVSGNVNLGTTTGNSIGESTGTGSIQYTSPTYGTYCPSFTGLRIDGAGPVYVQNNIVGSITMNSNTAANAVNFDGICLWPNYMGTCVASNNSIGSISTPNSIYSTSTATTDPQTVRGIYCGGAGSTVTISNNTIANLTNGSCNTTVANNGFIYGLFITQNSNTVSGNTIRDLTITNANTGTGPTSAAPTTTSLSAAGIALAMSANYAQNITGNTIYNISNTYSSFAGHVAGIYFWGGSTANSVSRNLIYGLSVNSGSTSAIISGIKIAGGVTTYSNNILVLSGNTTTSMYGIYDAGSSGTSNLYFNTSYLSGSPSSGSLNSACLYNAANSSIRNYRNNLFVNARSNNGASGKHYALYIATTGGNLTCDYNDYYFEGTGGTMGYYGGDKAFVPIVTGVTGNDAHSWNLNPSLASAGGTSANNYIPSTALTAVTGTGITIDHGGTTRSASSPEIGAWEQNNTITWTGTTDTDWLVAGNWDSGTLPTASTNVSIPSAPVNQPHITSLVSSPAVCNNLSIESGAILTINSGKALTVNGSITNNAGNSGLLINSDETGTGSLIQSSSSVGATVQRYITGSATLEENIYHFVSIPLDYASPTSNLFLGSYLDILDATQTDSTNNDYYGKWVNLGSSTTTPLSVHKGYMIYYPGASKTYTFNGNLNTGLFSTDVSYGGTYTFNLVPNPYPSAINWGAAGGWIKTNIGSTAWIWNYSGGNYTTLSGTSYVPVGQAFIVMATGSSPVLSMNNNACVHNTQAFYKSDAENTLKITARSNNYYDEAFLSFDNTVAPGFDPQSDGFKMRGLEEAPQLWTEEGDEQLSINKLPTPSENLSVPLDFTTTYSGPVTLNFTGMESFNPTLKLKLQDHINGSIIDLRQNSIYEFSHDPSNIEKRFSLIFGSPDGENEVTVNKGKVYISECRIFIELPSMQNRHATIRVYDLLGQIISTNENRFDGQFSIEAPDAKGIYIVEITTADRKFVAKVVKR